MAWHRSSNYQGNRSIGIVGVEGEEERPAGEAPFEVGEDGGAEGVAVADGEVNEHVEGDGGACVVEEHAVDGLDAGGALDGGLDGTTAPAATIRRHSTLRAGPVLQSTRLVGRSVWNDKWLLVIPASSLNADREKALETFVSGIRDIRLGFRAYSRSGN